MNSPLRVALFTDCFHEVNGVALTCRELQNFAERRGLPFFSAHAGPRTRLWRQGSVTVCELKRSPVRFAIESDLHVDLALMRHWWRTLAALEEFRPDLVHVTSCSDFSILGLLLADRLKIPAAAAWHTNVHRFAAWRLKKVLSSLPDRWRDGAGSLAEERILRILKWYYGKGRVLLAPNQELVELLGRWTGRPAFLMQRGVDTARFSPAKRDRGDGVFELGYVGRVSAEKNVRFLKKLEDALLAAGLRNFRITVVGGGGERGWLERNLAHGVFPGVLRGEELARAYANFDLFVFPSYTDTFGNVILESLASGVPAVVTDGGGPKFLVRDGVTGLIAGGGQEFIARVIDLMRDRERHARMRQAAREAALSRSWDAVFETLYRNYEAAFARKPASAHARTAA